MNAAVAAALTIAGTSVVDDTASLLTMDEDAYEAPARSTSISELANQRAILLQTNYVQKRCQFEATRSHFPLPPSLHRPLSCDESLTMPRARLSVCLSDQVPRTR